MRLNPVVTVDGHSFVLMTQFMVAVPVRDLKQVVTTLSLCRDDVVQAFDLLLTRF